MKRPAVLLMLITALVMGWPHRGLALPLVTNGDFSSATALEGWNTSGTEISEPKGDFAQLATDGTFQRTLEQTFTIPSIPGLPTLLTFDFAFSTEGTPISGGPFDSFAVSLETTSDREFLDILVVDALGVIPDPSDGEESLTGATPIDVAYDPSISIPGFTPFVSGTTFSGRISLFLPDVVLGEEATIFFDLLDQNDGFQTIAAVDNIAVEPVPEPATVILLGSGLVGLIGWGRRKFSIPA